VSDLTVSDVKKYLDVIHNADDDKLQMLLDAAEDEALQFLDRPNLTDWRTCAEIRCDEVLSESASEVASEISMPASVRLAILILVQASYQSAPGQLRHEAEQLRDIAEKKLYPYRCRLGV